MTREELNELLKAYADDAYWHGEDTGDYGAPDPDTHKKVECKIWDAIQKNSTPNKINIRSTLAYRKGHISIKGDRQ